MPISNKDAIDACRDLGFVCRWSVDYREFRLARPITAYRHYGRGAAGVQECEAYYTNDSEDVVDTARRWARNLCGWNESRIDGILTASTPDSVIDVFVD